MLSASWSRKASIADDLRQTKAMRRLGVTPSLSFAFEDSPSGLRAARASGAHVFGLTSSLTPEELRQAGAHEAIADFAVAYGQRTREDHSLLLAAIARWELPVASEAR